MKKINRESSNFVVADNGLPPFDDLQPLFDEQCRRVEAAVGRMDVRALSLNVSHVTTARHRLRVVYHLLAVVNLLVCGCVFVAFRSGSGLYVSILGYALMAVSAALATGCLYSSYRLRLSRFVGGNSADTAASAMAATVREGFFTSPLFVYARQVAAVSAVAIVTFVTVSCSPKGDGLAMSQRDLATRAAVTESIDTMLANI